MSKVPLSDRKYHSGMHCALGQSRDSKYRRSNTAVYISIDRFPQETVPLFNPASQ